jgi:hypothetical protein
MEHLLNIFLEPVNNCKDDFNHKDVHSNIQEIKESVLSVFQLPITYNSKKMKLNENIINDLELVQSNSTNENTQPIYQVVFQPQTCFGKTLLKTLPKYYTTDVEFLKETQNILKKAHIYNKDMSFLQKDANVYDKILENYTNLKHDNGFLQKYLYIDYEHFLFLNNNELFLQLLSMYNILSPVLTFLIPIFLLILPFIIVKMQGIPITFNVYKKVLYMLMSQHSLGKVFTQFNSVDIDKKIYLIISGVFYIFSIYTNVMSCIRFYKNMHHIHEYLEELFDKKTDLVTPEGLSKYIAPHIYKDIQYEQIS